MFRPEISRAALCWFFFLAEILPVLGVQVKLLQFFLQLLRITVYNVSLRMCVATIRSHVFARLLSS